LLTPRYLRAAIINGWPAAPSVMPAAEWLISVLRAADRS
jgi:hypothetical protein